MRFVRAKFSKRAIPIFAIYYAVYRNQSLANLSKYRSIIPRARFINPCDSPFISRPRLCRESVAISMLNFDSLIKRSLTRILAIRA